MNAFIAIIRWEIQQRRKYLLWWSIGIVALMVMLVSLYPSIRDAAAQLNQAMQQMPESLRNMRGDQDLVSPAGYLSGEIYYMTLPLLLIVMSIGLGSSLLAKDEQAHTLELLLARPVSRGRILAAKAVAGIGILFFITTLATLAVIGMAQVVNLQLSIVHILLAASFTMLFCLGFGAVAYAMTATSIARRSSIGIVTMLALVSYLLASLANLAGWVDKLSKLLPYHYFDTYHMLRDGTLPRGLCVYLIWIFAICLAVAAASFRHRDIE